MCNHSERLWDGCSTLCYILMLSCFQCELSELLNILVIPTCGRHIGTGNFILDCCNLSVFKRCRTTCNCIDCH